MHEQDPMSDGRLDTVLVATDFSQNASAALDWAVEVARAHGALVNVLHVAPTRSAERLPIELQDQIAQSMRAIEARLERASVEFNCRWTAGRPWEVISEIGEEHDLVVIGARGHTPHAVHPLGIGSTADRVRRSCPSPVLTVHVDDVPAGDAPRRILVPIDFSHASANALDVATTLVRPTAADPIELTLLHAWQPMVEYGDAFGSMLLPNRCADTMSQAAELLDDIAARITTPSVHVKTVVKAGYPARIIEDEAAARPPTLIAMGTHGHSGLSRLMLGSVAERVVNRVGAPVLSIGPAVPAPSAEHVEADAAR